MAVDTKMRQQFAIYLHNSIAPHCFTYMRLRRIIFRIFLCSFIFLYKFLRSAGMQMYIRLHPSVFSVFPSAPIFFEYPSAPQF